MKIIISVTLAAFHFLVVNDMTSNKLPRGISEKVVHEAMHNELYTKTTFVLRCKILQKGKENLTNR